MGLILSNNSGGNLRKADAILKIDGLAVNKFDNTDYKSIEVGDEIRGELPKGSGRHIEAMVMKLPYTNDGNLNIYSINNL